MLLSSPPLYAHVSGRGFVETALASAPRNCGQLSPNACTLPDKMPPLRTMERRMSVQIRQPEMPDALSYFDHGVVDVADGSAVTGSLARSTTCDPRFLSGQNAGHWFLLESGIGTRFKKTSRIVIAQILLERCRHYSRFCRKPTTRRCCLCQETVHSRTRPQASNVFSSSSTRSSTRSPPG